MKNPPYLLRLIPVFPMLLLLLMLQACATVGENPYPFSPPVADGTFIPFQPEDFGYGMWVDPRKWRDASTGETPETGNSLKFAHASGDFNVTAYPLAQRVSASMSLEGLSRQALMFVKEP